MATSKYAKAVEASNIYAKSGEVASRAYVSTELPDYTIHTTLSDNQSVVLQNASDPNDIVIAYRGTVHPTQQDPIEGLLDYASDVVIASGLPAMFNPRVNEAEQKYLRVEHTYPGANVKVAGHSLGGAESYAVATKYNLEGHHYNIGSSPVSKIPNMLSGFIHENDTRYTRQNIYHTDYYKSLGNVYVGADPVSESSKHLPGNHTTLKVNSGTAIGAHSLANFIRGGLDNNNILSNIKQEWPTQALKPTQSFNPRLFTHSTKRPKNHGSRR